MIKILVCCTNALDTTSYYRAAGPLGALRSLIPGLTVEYPDTFVWLNIRSSDIVFLQRPCLPEHLKLAEMTKDCGIPLWVEMDDDVLNVPPENKSHVYFREQEMRETVVKILQMADVVTTASDELKKRFSQYNQNIVAIPNALDETWLKNYDPINKPKDQNLMFWRGSDSHIRDLMTVQEEIGNVAKLSPQTMWRFAGYLPWFLVDKVPQDHFQHIKELDLMRYFKMMKESTHGASFFPLDNNDLNACKSNISWQENTLAGAAMLAPSFPEFQKPGIINYSSPGEFQELLLEMTTGYARNLPMSYYLKTSLEYIVEELGLSKINRMRVEVIDSLLSPNTRLEPTWREIRSFKDQDQIGLPV